MPEFEYEYILDSPGTIDEPPARALPPHKCTMDADTVDKLMRAKQQAIAENTQALVAALDRHQAVIEGLDQAIEALASVADTSELQDALRNLRAQRETLDRLLFTDGGELRKDSMTMTL